MLKTLDRRVYHAGKVLFHEGETGYDAYFIEEGLVEVFTMVSGERTVLGTIGDGGIVGEMALMDKGRRMASAIAVADTTCVLIPGNDIVKRINDADPMVAELLRVLVRNIRSETAERLETTRVSAPSPGQKPKSADRSAPAGPPNDGTQDS